MKALTGCISLDDLRDFASGALQADRSDAIEEHLATCDFCLHAFENVAGQDAWWSEVESALRDAPTVAGSEDPYESHGEADLLALLGPTDDPDMIGRIGIYEIVGVLGRGGMGVVFKAFDAGLNRFVAIKMLLPQLAASAAARARFRREGQAAAAVVDEHVLPIYAVDEWRGVPYLVTRYVRGTTLQRRLDDHGPMRLREILRIALHASHGLAAAHAQGLVHRDIKPSNILLEGSVDRAILADFGLARAVDDASMTRSGVLAGTPLYMSPEQVRGETIDQRSDLFSLGSALYAMCTGQPPFRAESSYAVMRRITDDTPVPICEINPDLPDWLERYVAWLMARDPRDRPDSAATVERILLKCLAHVERPWAEPLPPVLVRSSVRLPRPRFRRIVMLSLAVAAITLFAWSGSGFWPEFREEPRGVSTEQTNHVAGNAIAKIAENRPRATETPREVAVVANAEEAPREPVLEAADDEPARTEMKGETVAAGYRIRIAGTGSVEGLFPTTHFRQDLGLNAMQMQRSGHMESFRVEGGSFSGGSAFGQSLSGGGAFGESGSGGGAFGQVENGSGALGQSGGNGNSFEQSFSNEATFGRSSFAGGTFGQAGGTSGGFVGGGAGGKVFGGTAEMPNFGIALELTDANGKPPRRGQFVEISPEATIIESNGRTVKSPDSGPISRTFPHFEQRFPGTKAVYITRSADSDTPFSKLQGKLLITPGRNIEVHFKGTRPQTRKDDGAAFSLKSAKETGQGYQFVVEYPPTTLMKSAGNAFEMMQALTTMHDVYGLTLIDSEGNEHQPVSRSSGAAAGSSFRSVSVNGVTRSESTNSPANSMTTVTYGFSALPENVRVESLVATAIDRQGKPKVVPFTIEIDSK